jgi:hypothetical protein
MAPILLDVTRQLRDHERHISASMDRMSKSADVRIEMQQRIRASVALIERASSQKWSMNLPTLPKWINTLQAQNSTSESKSN